MQIAAVAIITQTSKMMPSIVRSFLHAFAFVALFSSTGITQTIKGTVLPYSTISRGSKLQVTVAETVSEVALEYKAKGSDSWTTLATTVKNPPGGTRVVVDVPQTLRSQDLRVKAWEIRPAPQTVNFTAGKGKTQMLVAAGLAAGTKLSAEYFDTRARQWKRFAAVEAPQDTSKSWSIAVPRSCRAAALRLTRIDSTTPGNGSSRFPAAFRTGRTKFPAKEISNSAVSYPLASNSAQLMGDTSSRSATPQIEESDIWKISGTKVFFFNQLRGLQVIDTANPADPEIVSFLRMPAVGEDMYVLPDSRAVLVRRDWKTGGTTGVVLVDTSQPQAKIISEIQVPGWYADSRLIDGRLVLATSQWNTSSWQSTTTVSVIDDLATAPRIAGEAALDFAASAMGTGSDFVWFAGNKNWSSTQSSIALFPIDALPALGSPLRAELGGMIYDKFKVHQNGDSLFAVTQNWNWGTTRRQSTALESYTLAGEKPELLQRLPLVEGESLHATRFDGNRAYVVTFEQIDPLWIIDLSDPSAMRIESELQVPGWSTYIQPVGGYLAAVGVDGGKVTASLFDVRDPANPLPSSRVDIGGEENGYTWSEANWDEKAVAILPGSGLILLPFSSFNSDGDVAAVQLVDMDAKNGKLTKRGVIRHAFTPRRANALREGILASISNRELFLLDATNRDKPAALADVTLAFAADRILGSRDGLLVHAENGDWRGSAAVLRVSSSADPDAVVAQAALGDGDIIAGALRGNHIVALLRGRKNPGEGCLVRFDASKLPALVETGRCSISLDAGWNASVDLVWPSDNLAVAGVRGSDWNWWRGPWIYDAVAVNAVSAKMSMSPAIYPRPYYFGEDTVTLHAFDLTSAVPRVVSNASLYSSRPRNTSKFFAADGLVVFSYGRAEEEVQVLNDNVRLPRTLEKTFLRVVDYADSATPNFWPEATLPGRLENIAEFDRSAGLVFAENNAGGLEALLYEGGTAQSITTLPTSNIRSVDGRRAWTFSGKNLARYRLSDGGAWELEDTRSDLPFIPSALRAHQTGVLARGGDALAIVPADSSTPLKNLFVPGWGWWWSQDLSQVEIGTDSVSVPTGQYGVEILR